MAISRSQYFFFIFEEMKVHDIIRSIPKFQKKIDLVYVFFCVKAQNRFYVELVPGSTQKIKNLFITALLSNRIVNNMEPIRYITHIMNK